MDNQLLQMPNPMILPTGEHLPAERKGHYEPIKQKPLTGGVTQTPAEKAAHEAHLRAKNPPPEDDDLGVWGHHIWTAGDAASALKCELKHAQPFKLPELSQRACAEWLEEIVKHTQQGAVYRINPGAA